MHIENTPTIIYSLGDSRLLKWEKRRLHKPEKGQHFWVDNSELRSSFFLDSDYVAIINPLDKNPLSNKNMSELS